MLTYEVIPRAMAMQESYIERILKARVYDVAIESPLEPARRLSRRLGNDVLFKREDLQPVFSFKLRGAYNKISTLDDATAARGVICASAGNHAQGVALAARRRGIAAVIVMPRTTPHIKVQAVLDLGGEVVLEGDDFDHAFEHATGVARARGLTFIHPFDDPDVIAGQGTIGMEILRQCSSPPHAIFVPIGGGGLIAGIATYVKSLYPQVRIVGVEPEDAASMHDSLRAGERVTLDRVGIFADGVAVRRVGEETFRLARKYVDEVLLVTTDEICAAIQDIFEDNRTIAEPAGALAVAGIKRYVAREQCTGQTLVALNCGANVNFDRLRHIAERADIGAQREALLAVEIPEEPGSFLRFCRLLGRRSVTEFNYRYDDSRSARIFAGIALAEGRREKEALLALGGRCGLPRHRHERRRDGEAARALHGGRPRARTAARAPVPFRVSGAPGRAAALPGGGGRALEHQPVPLPQPRLRLRARARGRAGGAGTMRSEFAEHLGDLGYVYTEETENPAYRMFLGD